jgi:predicted nucleic acid-binding protein
MFWRDCCKEIGAVTKIKKRSNGLGPAIAGGAQYVITGDKDLLSTGEFQNIKLLNPHAFWLKMKNTAEG